MNPGENTIGRSSPLGATADGAASISASSQEMLQGSNCFSLIPPMMSGPHG
jgi:hypothetical protein